MSAPTASHRRLWIGLAGAAVALCGLAGAAWYYTGSLRFFAALVSIRAGFMQVRQLSTAGLAGWLADPRRVPPLILDVREPAEFEISHLTGARSIPWRSDWRGPLGDVPRTRPIVVYCSIGYRSSAVARELTQAGFTQVSNLEGSIFKWANEGRVLVGPDGNVASVVHPYDARWGRLLAPNLRAPIP